MKILVIEDEPSVRLGLCSALKGAGHQVGSAANARDGIALFQKEQHDLVITDLVMPGDGSGLEVLTAVKEQSPRSGVMIITAFGNVKTAVEAMRQGAFDYVAKPFEPDELLIAIDRFAHQTRLEQENILLREEVREKRQLEHIVGDSPAIQRLCDTVRAAARTDVSVLILGETGTGKELVANALCALSPRHDKPIVKINCAAVPETLFESELFGYEKGAFTGAMARRKGKLEAAQGGTILFDEIGDMPLTIQAKLLRVIEERQLERLGGNDTIAIDVRFLYATSKNLKDAVKSGAFRSDLYYRVNVVPVEVPPLRERRQDIPLLIRHFLDGFSARAGRRSMGVTPSALAALEQYDFPGNVRELRHAMEMAVALCPDDTITLRHLPAEIREASVAESTGVAEDTVFLQDKVRRLEHDEIIRALAESSGKKALAAERLGICRRTLWKKMRDLRIVAPDAEDDD